MRVLLVEDDTLLGDAIKIGLEQAGFAADWMRDGVAGELAWQTEPYAAVVLDLGLPRRDGLELLRRRRAAKDATPVLILTARDAIEDRVKGLDSGADDYLIKPFDMAELAARLRALIRRGQGAANPILQLGELSLDPAAHRVSYRAKPVELSPREFAVLHELMRHPNRVLSRGQLEQSLYAWGEEVESNAIEVHIHHLRRKLSPSLIRTIRGVGYMLTPSADDATTPVQ